jgi:hypothetical protein
VRYTLLCCSNLEGGPCEHVSHHATITQAARAYLDAGEWAVKMIVYDSPALMRDLSENEAQLAARTCDQLERSAFLCVDLARGNGG